MITDAVMGFLGNPWVLGAIVIGIPALCIGIALVRRESPEEVSEVIRQMHADLDFGVRQEPLYEGLLSSYSSGQWYARPLQMTARWHHNLPCFREQTGVLRSPVESPTERQVREVFLFDGGEWARTHAQSADSPVPGETEPHVTTRTRDSRLPLDLRWNKRGPNPVHLPASDAQGEQSRQVLFRADQRLRRATALWRWGYRIALTGLLISLVLLPLGDEIHQGLFALGMLGTALLLPASALLRWARITAVRRRGHKMLTTRTEERHAAAWVNREVLAQWRAGGHDFWEFAPALPPVMAWSWRKDSRLPIIALLSLGGLVGVVLVGVSLVQVLEWLDGAPGFPTALVISTAVLVALAAAAGWLSMRPDDDYARFGQLMDELRHAEGVPAPHRVSPWPAPEKGRPILTTQHEGIHERIDELFQQSRAWRRNSGARPGLTAALSSTRAQGMH